MSISNTYVDPVLRAEDAAVDAMLCAGCGAAAVRAVTPPRHRPAIAPCTSSPRRRIYRPLHLHQLSCLHAGEYQGDIVNVRFTNK